ncbi:bark storage protein A [Amborella trichopoda]|uniref:bark storage protein A n=1 Tax=Amborella trichopoda TaxID=13333 RepID=UPI0005D3058C|nr:bark storage protein A [Amborella trichopoda]|eukprot:XP_006833371.2 bark storage protein A [Amborella trichopoda]
MAGREILYHRLIPIISFLIGIIIPLVVLIPLLLSHHHCSLTGRLPNEIMKINEHGPFVGLVVSNSVDLSLLLQSSSFKKLHDVTHLDFGGRRFHIGQIGKQNVTVVAAGRGMLNTGVTTKLLTSLFKIKGVINCGLGGSVSHRLRIGDVVVPYHWAHTGNWNWQRYGDGPQKSSNQSSGKYCERPQYLHFAAFNKPSSANNLLNNVWFEAEDVFPKIEKHKPDKQVFWIPAHHHYISISGKLKAPQVRLVNRGSSSNIFINNTAYANFLYSRFHASVVDKETAAVSLVCLEEDLPFIAFRAVSNLAGAESSTNNEASTFAPLAAKNAVMFVLKFLTLLK